VYVSVLVGEGDRERRYIYDSKSNVLHGKGVWKAISDMSRICECDRYHVSEVLRKIIISKCNNNKNKKIKNNWCGLGNNWNFWPFFFFFMFFLILLLASLTISVFRDYKFVLVPPLNSV
jgi:hypothetical protein